MTDTRYYTMNDVLEVVRELSYSQGFYGRLLRDLLEIRDNDSEKWEELCEYITAQKFTEPLDVVYFFEC